MEWTCEDCLEDDPDIDTEKVLYQFDTGQHRTTFHGDSVDYGGYAHKYDEPYTDRGGTDE